MEQKKSKKADLERNISIYFSVGLIIALSLSLIAFEWASEPVYESIFDFSKGEIIEIEVIPYSFNEKEKPDLPIVPPEIFIIREDDYDIDTEIEWIDDKIVEGTEIAYILPDFKDEPELDEAIYFIPGEMPTFRDGNLLSFVNWTQKRLKYPQIAAENGVEGKVYLEFIVEKDGSLSNLQVLKSPDQAFEEEAIRVISTSPKWESGKNNGIPVRVKCSMVLRFVLQK